MRRQLCCVVVVLTTLAANAGAQTVTKVSGAETLVVSGIGKVRLIGITAPKNSALRIGPSGPPSQPRSGPSSPPPSIIGGRINLTPDRSSETALKKLVLGKTVRIEYDPLAGNRESTPRVYVFLQDGTLVNAEMLRQGRARVDDSRGFLRLDEFQQLEQEAREGRRGIWLGGGVQP